MEYPWHNMSGGNILASTKKVDDVKDWTVPTTVMEISSFVLFCNSYAKFIHHFSDLNTP
jgi:hypothetical protein